MRSSAGAGRSASRKDSPVLPDVWIEYALRPGQAVSLLLEPSGGTSPATVYRALADKLGEQGSKGGPPGAKPHNRSRRHNAGAAYRDRAAADPMVADSGKKGLAGSGPWQVFPALARPGAATLAPDDISVAEEFMADLVALAETRDAVYYAPELFT